MIETWSRGVAADYMSEDMIIDSIDINAHHPWQHARTNLIIALLRSMEIHPPADILDVGCGWGITLDALERRGYQAVGLDISRRILERLDRPGRDLIEADFTQSLPLNARQYTAVLALDLIEHLDDDHAAVAKLAQLTKTAGVIIIGVPALPDLFSEFDVVQGHRRRYLPHTLRKACSESNLSVEQIFWWGSWLVPLLRRQRSRSHARKGMSPSEIFRRYVALPPWPIRLGLRLAFALDQKRTLRGKAHTGTSLFAVVRRLR